MYKISQTKKSIFPQMLFKTRHGYFETILTYYFNSMANDWGQNLFVDHLEISDWDRLFLWKYSNHWKLKRNAKIFKSNFECLFLQIERFYFSTSRTPTQWTFEFPSRETPLVPDLPFNTTHENVKKKSISTPSIFRYGFSDHVDTTIWFA